MRRWADVVVPGAEEDAAITAAALTDPDNLPVTETDFANMPAADVPGITSTYGGPRMATELELLLMLLTRGGELQPHASALLHERFLADGLRDVAG